MAIFLFDMLAFTIGFLAKRILIMNALNILSYLLGVILVGLVLYFIYRKMTNRKILPLKGLPNSKNPGDNTQNRIP